ncbi:hypothetical protein [Actinoplanes sp. GCM10030250]|uniref:hypothetical protein n=1 Tax=Actinoplanes sp. GCM10030250 TaxID=3273376 RepID=UPI0036161EA2
MTILRRVAVALTVLLAAGLAPGAASAKTGMAPGAASAKTGMAPGAASAKGLDALASVYDENSRVLAEARFASAGDTFTLIKLADHGSQVYAEYKYVRKDGTLQTGTHRGPALVGVPARFDHDFGEGRAVEFRVCVATGYGSGLCSGTDQGENWTKAYA